MIRILVSLALLLGLTTAVQAKEIKDVAVDDQLTLEGHSFVLNGAGIRSKFFLDVYIAALYLQKQESDAAAIVAADEPMAIRLHITSGMINSKRMSESTRDGFVRSTGGNLAPIEGDVEELIKAFKDEIKEGDVFDLVYEPETGVTVYKNGVAASNVKGLAFKQALFGIWLSDDPIQSSLKKSLVSN
ncbi:chalcone isomerase family protein [Thalassolituus sp. LLYu03]|uniref:chalcone isomerase family protein n=1 Tax=Thalassolituus sp. LLYu03 TaxID=3421656 RepID=UPI003D284AE2